MERRAAILSVARNPRTARDERLALVEWLADLPLDERSSSLRSDAELDMIREVESADARKDVRAMTADKDVRPSLVTQRTLEIQVVTAPSRAMPLAKNGKSIEDAPTVREYHKRTATSDRATATTSFTADRELSVAVKRAAAQAGVDAEHRRSARLDLDEFVLSPVTSANGPALRSWSRGMGCARCSARDDGVPGPARRQRRVDLDNG
jgi:hypothetical protein